MKANEAGHLARVAGAAPHTLIVSRLAAGAAVVRVPRAKPTLLFAGGGA